MTAFAVGEEPFVRGPCNGVPHRVLCPHIHFATSRDNPKLKLVGFGTIDVLHLSRCVNVDPHSVLIAAGECTISNTLHDFVIVEGLLLELSCRSQCRCWDDKNVRLFDFGSLGRRLVFGCVVFCMLHYISRRWIFLSNQLWPRKSAVLYSKKVCRTCSTKRSTRCLGVVKLLTMGGTSIGSIVHVRICLTMVAELPHRYPDFWRSLLEYASRTQECSSSTLLRALHHSCIVPCRRSLVAGLPWCEERQSFRLENRD